MPLVGAALQYGVGDKSTGFAVLSGEVMFDDAIFLNRVRRDGGVRAAGRGAGVHRVSASKALVVVIESFDQIVPSAAARAVYRGSAIGSAIHAEGDVSLRRAR